MPNTLHARLHFPDWAPEGLLHGRWFAPDASTRVAHIGRGVGQLRDAKRAEQGRRWRHVSAW